MRVAKIFIWLMISGSWGKGAFRTWGLAKYMCAEELCDRMENWIFNFEALFLATTQTPSLLQHSKFHLIITHSPDQKKILPLHCDLDYLLDLHFTSVFSLNY